MRRNPQLLLAAFLNLLVAFGHLLVIVMGAEAYRLAGAGDELANMAAAGSWYPAVLTSCIMSVFLIWALYAFSGAGVVKPLPGLQLVLLFITAVYCLRGLIGMLLLLMAVPDLPWSPVFLLMSSTICLLIGLVHLVGLRRGWGKFQPAGIIGSSLSHY